MLSRKTHFGHCTNPSLRLSLIYTMTDKLLLYATSSFSSSDADYSVRQTRTRDHPVKKPPRKPDWLLILVGVLILATLLIAWLVDIPGLFR